MADTIHGWAGELDYPIGFTTHRVARDTDVLAVHVVPAERDDLGRHQATLLQPIAAESGADLSRFRFHRAKRLEPGHET